MLLVLVVGLAFAPAAQAKLSLEFDRTSARAGDRVRLTFGEYFTSAHEVVRVYLVHAPILGTVIRPAAGGGIRRLGPPARLPGVVAVGQTTSGRPGLAFRVPSVRRGRYAAVLWCATCRYPYLLAAFAGGIPDDAGIRSSRGLLRVVR